MRAPGSGFASPRTEIERIGEWLVERTLPRPDWTYEAQLAATTYLPLRRSRH